jgi:hypothetical protein
MAEAQRGLRIYLITDEQYSVLQDHFASFPNAPAVQQLIDIVGTQSIGMLPAADLGNQGQRQAQFEKYRAVIAAAIGEVEPGLVEGDREPEEDVDRRSRRAPLDDREPGRF